MKINHKHIIYFVVYCSIVWLVFPENFPKWMRPEHCIPDPLFRWFTTISSTYICITYFTFAWAVKYKLASLLNSVVSKGFADALAWVFVLCGLEHATMGWSLVNQYIKTALIFIYPALIFYHTSLLINAKKTYDALLSIKSQQDYDNLIDAYKELEQENVEIKIMIKNSYSKKHWGLIGTFIRQNDEDTNN